jgi:hypothetical protein
VFTALRAVLWLWLVTASHLDWGGFSRPAIPLLIPAGIAADLLAARGGAGWISGLTAGAVTFGVSVAMLDLPAPAAGGIRLFWTAGVVLRSLAPALALAALMGAAADGTAAALGARRPSLPAGRDSSPAPAGVPPAMRTFSVRTSSAAGALVAAAVAAGAVRAGGAAWTSRPAPRASAPVRAAITITHRGPGRPSSVEVRVVPPGAAHGGELLLSIYRPGVAVNRRALEPAAPGVYRAQYLFPVDGAWRYYMRFGPGQAGFVTAGYIGIANQPAGVDAAASRFRSGLRRAPAYVQPLGYAACGLIAAVAVAAIAAVLSEVRPRADR